MSGNVTVRNNSRTSAPTGADTAVIVAGNSISGNMTVSDNRWAPSSGVSAALVAGNSLSGNLTCANNVGPASNQGVGNTAPRKSGQCAAL
jgi:hypothetical protein